MGYYTRYALEIERVDMDSDKLSSEEHELLIALSSGYVGLFGGDSIKWYDHQKDMAKYSERYPDTLFKLCGEGEESGDLWVAYFLNGKVQMCKAKLSYDDFDNLKLKVVKYD